jgi:FkbM family methyltransferase
MNNGGTILSYEPDEDCFEIMKMNYENNFDDSKWSIENCAISNKRQATLKFYKGGKDTDRYRTSLIPNTKDTIVLKNTHCSYIKDMKFDGIKMDIEGAEFGLIDEDLLPECDKLVMEYHLTKDKSMENFHKRMNKLRERFSEVLYMPSLDKEYPNGIYPGFFDRIIICKK